MRKVLLLLCALLLVGASVEAKKVKVKVPAAQKASLKQHQHQLKQMQKNRKPPKHSQRVN